MPKYESNASAVWMRLTMAVGLFVLLVGVALPDENPARIILLAVGGPLLLFLFGTEQQSVGRSAGRFLLPLFVTTLIPVCIDFHNSGSDFSTLPERGMAYLKALFLLSAGDTDDPSEFHLIWLLGVLWLATVICRFVLKHFGERIASLIAVLLCAGAWIIWKFGPSLPLALDTVMAGSLFYTAGALFEKRREAFTARRYRIGIPALFIWIAGIIYSLCGGPGYGVMLFVVSLAGILGIMMLTYVCSALLPRMMAVISLPGAFPVTFLCICRMAADISLWWSCVPSRNIQLILECIIIGSAAAAVGLGITSVLCGNADNNTLIKAATDIVEKYRIIPDVLFYLCFSVCYIRHFIVTTMFTSLIRDWTWIDWPNYYAVWLLILIAFISLPANPSRRMRVLQLFILFAGFFFWRCSGPFDIFALCVLIVAISGRRVRPALILSLIIGSGMMIAAYEASMNGYIPYLVYNTGGEYGSHAFGIIYRTDFGAHVLYLVMTMAVVRNKKLRFFEYMIFCFCTWVVWHYAHARMNTACLVLFLAGLAFIRLWDVFAKKPLKIPAWTASVHALCMAAIYGAVMIWGLSDGIAASDELSTFSARLNMSRRAFAEYSVRLFGNLIPERGAGGFPDTSVPYFALDISYVRTLLMYGLIMLIVYITVMTVASYRSLRAGNNVLALALVVVAVVSLIEHHATEISYNVFILSAFAASLEPAEPKAKQSEPSQQTTENGGIT